MISFEKSGQTLDDKMCTQIIGIVAMNTTIIYFVSNHKRVIEFLKIFEKLVRTIGSFIRLIDGVLSASSFMRFVGKIFIIQNSLNIRLSFQCRNRQIFKRI